MMDRRSARRANQKSSGEARTLIENSADYLPLEENLSNFMRT